MFGAAQTKHLQRLPTPGVRLARQVIQAGGLPPLGFGDPTLAPREHVVLAAELGHRLGYLHELVRPGQIAAEQRHDPLGVAIEHGQPLADVLEGERVLVIARRHALLVRG